MAIGGLGAVLVLLPPFLDISVTPLPVVRQVIQREGADAEDEARRGTLHDPFHGYGHPPLGDAIGRHQSSHAARDRIAEETFDTPEEIADGGWRVD